MATNESDEIEEVDAADDVYLRPMYEWSPALDEYLDRLLDGYNTLGQRVKMLEQNYPKPFVAPAQAPRQLAG
jgi:hypothetical protein